MRLNVNHCDFGGSSRHLRDFIAKGRLAEYAAKYPHVEVATQIRRGRHPHVTAEYRNGTVVPVDLRNKEEAAIRFQLHYLFSAKGRSSGKPIVVSRKVSKTESVQGKWQPGMFDAKNNIW